MAANTDLFKKLSRRWVGQIGAAGVADASVTTVPLSSATNLPTGTAVVLVIDRVDANGTATPSLEETVIGVVSGSNLTTCVRGAEGTAQAHNAGAVVEVLVTAKGWNDLIDGLLVSHNQDGSIGASAIVASNMSASSVTAGVLSFAVPGGDGWTSDSRTWTYASVSTFTVSGDVTATFSKGTKLKLTQTTAKYFYVIDSSHTAGTTTVTVSGGSDYSLANAAITSPYYSYAVNPQSFPYWFNYMATPTFSGGTPPNTVVRSISRFSIVGRTVSVRIKYEYTNAGSGNTTINFNAPVSPDGQEIEYNSPLTAVISSSGAGAQPDQANNIKSYIYATSTPQIYIYAETALAIKSYWVFGSYQF